MAIKSSKSSKPLIAMFRFTLGTDQSIGPKELKTIWMRASQRADVSVGCVAGPRAQDKPTYSLYATQSLEGLAEVETRLRRLLDQRNLRAALLCVHAAQC
ncbi:hypothetical protein ABIE51_000686 [Lysobacter sp. OAE881]|uniref:hypothetical protein n=1 Tax=Lysobacter TaxID=68 RepID=UPI0017892B78|nr:hypothetical protein [Lysobacter soli]MDG2517174.1 hypothetical protein [Lysobacter soli]